MSFAKVNNILGFWFREVSSPNKISSQTVQKWFQTDSEFDKEVTLRFRNQLVQGLEGSYDSWKSFARGSLALTILLDQFPRNMFRNQPEAFKYDQKALDVCLSAIERKQDNELYPFERMFLYMPMEHCEDLEMHDLMLEKLSQLSQSCDSSIGELVRTWVHFAERHRQVIKRFGRYPHRNLVLGRESTKEELKFIEENPQGF